MASISPETLKKEYNDAETFMRPIFAPFDEYERVARNKAREGLPDHVPKTTDGTLAAIVQDQPKRIIQQVPTGNFKVDDAKWLEIVAKHFVFDVLIKGDLDEAEPLQRYWAMVTKALTYGSQPSLVQYGFRDGRFKAYTVLPYVRDVLPEAGRVVASASAIVYVRSWYTDSQIDGIIESAKKSKDEESGWIVKELEDLKERKRNRDGDSATPADREKAIQQSGIEIAHRLERRIGGKIYSFDPLTGNILRERDNTHPFGDIAIDWLFANIDFSNPLGRGAVEMSIGMQNFIDTILQSYQYMAALSANPPLEMRGAGINKATIKFKNGAIWDLGSSPDASVKPVQLDKSIIQNMPNIYGLAKSQILALNANNDNSISAEAGNPGFSKTDAGVDAQQARLGISDNYMRKQFEAWFARHIVSLFYVHFLNAQGSETITLSDDDAMRMVDVAPERLLEDGRTVLIDYDEIRQIITGDDAKRVTFETAASTSAMEDTEKQIETLTKLLELRKLDPTLAQLINVAEIAQRIAVKSGVEDPEKIVSLDQQQGAVAVDPNTGQPVDQAAMGMPAQPGQEQQMQPTQPTAQPPQPMQPTDQQTQPAAQPELSQEEVQLINKLRELNVPDDLIGRALVMLRNDYEIADVLEVIKQSMEAQVNG